MKIHPLFPVTVCEFEYPDSHSFNQILSKNIFNHLDKNVLSDESTGHVAIHHDPNFYHLFCFIQNCVKQYMNLLDINTELFEINFVKSWFNILKDRNTRKHAHGDAHISIVYYANIPKENNQSIRFYNYEPRIEPYAGSMRYNKKTDGWNILNSYTWSFLPKEGDIFIFPASLLHDTTCEKQLSASQTGIKTLEDYKDHRIAIAADIVLTYKEKVPSPLGIQPLKNWRTFND